MIWSHSRFVNDCHIKSNTHSLYKLLSFRLFENTTTVVYLYRKNDEQLSYFATLSHQGTKLQPNWNSTRTSIRTAVLSVLSYDMLRYKQKIYRHFQKTVLYYLRCQRKIAGFYEHTLFKTKPQRATWNRRQEVDVCRLVSASPYLDIFANLRKLQTTFGKDVTSLEIIWISMFWISIILLLTSF